MSMHQDSGLQDVRINIGVQPKGGRRDAYHDQVQWGLTEQIRRAVAADGSVASRKGFFAFAEDKANEAVRAVDSRVATIEMNIAGYDDDGLYVHNGGTFASKHGD